MRFSALLARVAAFFAVARPALVSAAIADDVCDRGTGEASIAACTRIIQDGRTSTENRAIAFNNRGRAYAGKGQYDRAIQDFDEAIRLKPNDAIAFYNRGRAYAAGKGQYDRAIQDFDQAIRLKPNDAIAFYNRGFAYARKGQPDRAIQDFDQAIRLNPNY